jgi:hypothetical protein
VFFQCLLDRGNKLCRHRGNRLLENREGFNDGWLFGLVTKTTARCVAENTRHIRIVCSMQATLRISPIRTGKDGLQGEIQRTSFQYFEDVRSTNVWMGELLECQEHSLVSVDCLGETTHSVMYRTFLLVPTRIRGVKLDRLIGVTEHGKRRSEQRLYLARIH